jgi:hypothetical protein
MGRRKNHVQRATPTPPPPNPVLTCANYRRDMNRHCSLEPGHSGLCFSAVFREHFVADSVFSVEES